MHEMSLAVNIIDIACSQVQDAGGTIMWITAAPLQPRSGVTNNFCLF
jgi:hypothetical protein